MSFSKSMTLSKLLNVVWSPSIPLSNPAKLPSEGLHDSCSKGFHFLIRLAWESRYLLPIMYVVFSFLFDIQMRLQFIMQGERGAVHGNLPPAVPNEDADSNSETEESDSENSSDSEVEEEEMEEEEDERDNVLVEALEH